MVTVGAGGVGKTTVAAALALRAAVDGRSSLVCTIDPAKRLANSLGLKELGNAESLIEEARLQGAGLQPKAPLRAMMLDMKQTWDELIEKLAPPGKREKILANRFYQSLSSALAGSQEYIAMEKLWQLRTQRDYQLIVLDTPPTAHALDFLDAPNRVLDFIDNEAARWLLTPALAAGKVGLKLFNLGTSYVAKTLTKFTGVETLAGLAEFMSSISGMNQDFRERASQVRELLGDERTSFVLVTSPVAERLDEVVRFHTLLQQNHMRIAAVVVNRVHLPPTFEAMGALNRLDPQLRRKVAATLDEVSALAHSDSEGIKAIAKECEGTPLIEVPRFDLDVHDLPSLWKIGRFLCGDEAVARA
ncbi:MAG TPA: ArsA-related P-loop ATPase [Myxococcales bacterium]|nr:ArsA-related P-loop ATPase [Myxococcales bacterium]